MKRKCVRLKTIRLLPDDYARREAWRRYQIHCARLINAMGIDEARKMRPK